MATSRGLTKAHFNWKTKCKFAMGILNPVLKFDSRDLYHKVCNWRRGLIKYELSCLSLRDQRTWQKHDSLNIISTEPTLGKCAFGHLTFIGLTSSPKYLNPQKLRLVCRSPIWCVNLPYSPSFPSICLSFCLCYFFICHQECLYFHQITYKKNTGKFWYIKNVQVIENLPGSWGFSFLGIRF